MGLLGAAVLFMEVPASHAQIPPSVQRDGEAIAVVDGQEIAPERFNRLLAAMTRKASLGDGHVPEPILRQTKLDLAERLIAEQLIENAASDLGIFAKDSDLDAALEQFRLRFETQEAFDLFVDAYPLGLPELRHRLRILWLRDQVLKAEGQPLSEEGVKAFYESHPERFNLPEQYLVREVFVPAGPRDSASERRAKLLRAQQLHKTALSPGKPFESLGQKSADGLGTTEARGPRQLTAQRVEPKVWELLSRLSPGGISEVVETESGFHLFYMVEKKAAAPRSYAEVKDEVRAEFEQFMSRRQRKTLLLRLRAMAQVSNFVAERMGSPQGTERAAGANAGGLKAFDAPAVRPPSPLPRAERPSASPASLLDL